MKYKAITNGLRNAALIVLITTAFMIGLIATPSKIVAQAACNFHIRKVL